MSSPRPPPLSLPFAYNFQLSTLSQLNRLLLMKLHRGAKLLPPTIIDCSSLQLRFIFTKAWRLKERLLIVAENFRVFQKEINQYKLIV